MYNVQYISLNFLFCIVLSWILSFIQYVMDSDGIHRMARNRTKMRESSWRVRKAVIKIWIKRKKLIYISRRMKIKLLFFFSKRPLSTEKLRKMKHCKLWCRLLACSVCVPKKLRSNTFNGFCDSLHLVFFVVDVVSILLFLFLLFLL